MARSRRPPPNSRAGLSQQSRTQTASSTTATSSTRTTKYSQGQIRNLDVANRQYANEILTGIKSGKYTEDEGLTLIQQRLDQYSGTNYTGASLLNTEDWKNISGRVQQQRSEKKRSEEDWAKAQDILKQKEAKDLEAKQEATAARERGLSELRSGEGRAAYELEQGATSAEEPLAVWRGAGEGALTKFQQAMGIQGGGGDLGAVLESLPGYKFRLDQGIQAATRMRAAGGGARGGGAMRELTELGQGMASDEFGRYLGGLSDLMGRGQAASTQIAGIREQKGINLANLRATSAAARANVETGMGTAMLGIQAQSAIASMGYAGGVASAGTERESRTAMMGWDQAFQSNMAKYSADRAESLARQQSQSDLYTALIGGIFQVGAAKLLK